MQVPHNARINPLPYTGLAEIVCVTRDWTYLNPDIESVSGTRVLKKVPDTAPTVRSEPAMPVVPIVMLEPTAEN